jgi:methylated-DNA-[protein]-cysteine S-methyltransferase
MSPVSFALFDSAVGRCAVVWGERGVVGVQLAESSESRTRARVHKRFPDAHESEAIDLSTAALDLDGVPPFHRRVYEIVRTIPPGSTRTYHQVAVQLKTPNAAGAVARALRQNPFPIVVPSHRVLGADGKIGGDVTTNFPLLSQETESTTPLDFDPSAAALHLRVVDPDLARLIDTIGPVDLRLNTARSVFFALAEAIVYQQLNGRVAEKIFARVCALFPYAPQGPSAEQLLKASDKKLRGAGLSGAKLLSLRDLARRVVAGEVPGLYDLRAMDDEAIIECLSQVRGIGRWTAEMFLIFRLGRPDVLPVDDYGVRQGFAFAMQSKLPTPQELGKYGERWIPFRTVASWYLWRAAERGRE